MTDDYQMINLKGISKPITKLINSVSKGIGTLYEPIGTVRNTKAEAKSIKILAEIIKDLDDKTIRAIQRLSHKETKRQENIDAIVKGALDALPEKVSKEEIDDDWAVLFFDLCQDISNEKMQMIWSRILAGEVSQPGKFSSRTIQAVKTLNAKEANLFTRLCEFSFATSDGTLILPTFSHDIFEFIRNNGLDVNAEIHLNSIGLLSNSPIWYAPESIDKKVHLKYFLNEYIVPPESLDDDEGYIEAFPFTETGQQLASIAGGTPDAKYIKKLIKSNCLSPIKAKQHQKKKSSKDQKYK